MEFFYQRFVVSESTLIPRLETESLVREAIAFARINKPDICIDIGTGSWAIVLSLLSAIHIPHVYATDISKNALTVAQRNMENHGKNITLITGDLLEQFFENTLLENNKSILLVTNLPYIKQDDWEHMSEDTKYEPMLALFWWTNTGFELYEKLFLQVNTFIEKYTPSNLTILAEMGEDQKDIATHILKSYGWEFSFFQDLRAIERFMRIKIR